MKAIVIADPADRDLGLLGDFLLESGATIKFVDRDSLSTGVEPSSNPDVIVLLGSTRSAHDPEHAEVVAAEIEMIQRSLKNNIPVLGICFGSQILARALGGSSARSPQGECGWTPVFSNDERLCPPGLWGQIHHDRFQASKTSTVIGWSPVGPQSYIDESLGGRAIGWQFHPEVTLPTFERWLRRGDSGTEGVDIERTLAEASEHAEASIPRAAALFAAAFDYLGIGALRTGRS
jgi:GMP synthase-like glutamine amidotransferase